MQLNLTRTATPVIGPESSPPIVVVGAGPVGVQAALDVLHRDTFCHVVLFGAESWQPYNRVQLSAYLAGDITSAELEQDTAGFIESGRLEFVVDPVVSIDRIGKQVTTSSGWRQDYRYLVLATGSAAHVPNISGVDTPGVYTFRDLDDAQRLAARRLRSRCTVVIGGGLLGLEAARAMQRFNTHVVVIEHATHLMFNQLDSDAGRLLREHVESKGIEVITNESVAEIEGQYRVERVKLKGGRHVDCDTVVLATGIRPRIDIARDAGLSVGRGIRVDHELRTSDECIFAVGECAEYNDAIYGLVGPGLEQAAVAASIITGNRARYAGSINATRLKVLDLDVFSAGETRDEEAGLRSVSYSDGASIYRRLLLRHGRLVGVVSIGSWNETPLLQQQVAKRSRLSFLGLRRFRDTGALLGESTASDSVIDWPDSAVVCNCRQVTRGELGVAMGGGCKNIEALVSATGAASVCGSCRPLLGGLLGEMTRIAPVQLWLATLTVSLLAITFAVLQLSLPSPSFTDSVQSSIQLREWLSDTTIRQITGFTLAGVTALVALMSARKRVSWFKWGRFTHWRFLHVAASTLALGLVLAHTSASVGEGINRWLLVSYLGAAVVGIALSAQVALEHRFKPRIAKQSRSALLWAHVLLVWPLPLLLVAHVLKTYWF